jgi:hypothetical protein
MNGLSDRGSTPLSSIVLQRKYSTIKSAINLEKSMVVALFVCYGKRMNQKLRYNPPPPPLQTVKSCNL